MPDIAREEGETKGRYLARVDGEIVHKDSLGTDIATRPGALNWMRAGRGIVHSERTTPERKRSGQRLFGIQTWVALPEEQEKSDPAFAHPGHHGAGERRGPAAGAVPP
jgi:redox-sensitive bicupin YhaK (pirin superfamily)